MDSPDSAPATLQEPVEEAAEVGVGVCRWCQTPVLVQAANRKTKAYIGADDCDGDGDGDGGMIDQTLGQGPWYLSMAVRHD